jgi:hypothetical protein
MVYITEYRAQVLVDVQANKLVAELPLSVTRPIQYGLKTKASVVYMSQYQLTPYNRIEDYFSEQISLSTGSFDCEPFCFVMEGLTLTNRMWRKMRILA